MRDVVFLNIHSQYVHIHVVPGHEHEIIWVAQDTCSRYPRLCRPSDIRTNAFARCSEVTAKAF
jgi:hypothetical protein